MLKRLWLVGSILWALLVFGGMERPITIEAADNFAFLALLPLIGGYLLAKLVRFVRGS